MWPKVLLKDLDVDIHISTFLGIFLSFLGIFPPFWVYFKQEKQMIEC